MDHTRRVIALAITTALIGAGWMLPLRASAAPLPRAARLCFSVQGAPGDAAVVNLTPVGAGGGGNGQLISSDVADPPVASNVNFAPGSVDPNVAIARIGLDGKVCFVNSNHTTVDLVADHLGTIAGSAYTPASPNGAPNRRVDTRIGLGGERLAPSARLCFSVQGAPGDAAVVNLTPVGAGGGGNGQLVSSDLADPPVASNVNFGPGSVDPNVAISRIGVDGKVCFVNSNNTSVDLVADHLGTIAAGAYSPATASGAPSRRVDTRIGLGGSRLAPSARLCFSVQGAPGDAAVVNLTPVGAGGGGNGQLVSSDIADPPVASNVNFAPGSVDPNVAIARIGVDGKVCFVNSNHTSVDLVADHLGTIAASVYTPASPNGAPNRRVDTRIDLVAPTITLTSVPTALTSDTTPSVSFTISGNVAAVTCHADSAPAAPCTSPFTAGPLADGAHTLSISATDATGNPTTATTATFTIDATPPTISFTSSPAALSNDPTPSVSFTTGGNPVTVTCRADNTTPVACTSPYTAPVLGEGSHTISVTATDAALNSSTLTAAAFTIDTTPPVVIITNAPPPLTNDATPSVSFTVTGGPATASCRVDTGSAAACTSPFTSGSLADGVHTISISAIDFAGNPSTASIASFTIDTTPPSIDITSAPPAFTNDDTPSVSFTVTGSAATVTCKVDDGSASACTSPFNAPALGEGAHTISIAAVDFVGNPATVVTASFTIDTTPPQVILTFLPPIVSNNPTQGVLFSTAGDPVTVTCHVDDDAPVSCSSQYTTGVLADGGHTITITATDAAGNVGTGSVSFTIDTTPPSLVITSAPPPITNDSTPSVSFTVSSNAFVTCKVDGGSASACTSPFNAPALGEGAHTIAVRAVDAAGNPANATTSFTIDTTPPTVSLTSAPPAFTNDSTPSVSFTTGGNPLTVTCHVDSAPSTACTSPFMAGLVTDGAHTISITATDAAGNPTTATATFTVDTTPPTLTLTSAPPALWPVNYFDVAFTSGEAVSFQCSLNGAAFSACASPVSITTTYDVASTFSVRATDAAGNPTTKSVPWTSVAGLVLHLPWEHGSTTNTSLLAQVPGYSPNGSAPTIASVGGWAGTAITNSPAHTYVGTVRALSSSPSGAYAMSMWIRPQPGAFGTGTLVDTVGVGNTGGLRVTLSSGQLTVVVASNGGLSSGTMPMPPDSAWHSIALRTTGPASGLRVFLDGQSQMLIASPVGNGFGTGQRSDMQVGPFTGLDLDDLSAYNRSLSDTEMCTVVARGQWDAATSTCKRLVPIIEYDFERNDVLDSGSLGLPGTPPSTTPSFVTTETGTGIQLATPSTVWGVPAGLQPAVANAPGRSIAFWVSSPNANSGVVWDSSKPCLGNPAAQCGIRLTVHGSSLDVLAASSSAAGTTATVALPLPLNRVLVVERRNGAITQDVRVFVDGSLTATIPIGVGDIYAAGANWAFFVQPAGVTVDDYELWPVDLTTDPEMLCENGFDGEYHPVDGTCGM